MYEFPKSECNLDSVVSSRQNIPPCFEAFGFRATHFWTHLIRHYGIYISEFAFMLDLFSSFPLLELDTFICTSVFHSFQTMTNRCISTLIYQWDALWVTRVASQKWKPQPICMGGNWIACSEGERRRATHHSPIGFSESVAWKAISKRWMPRVCSLIHVESTSRSLSHPLHCSSERLMAVEWGCVRGPSHLWGNDQSLPHVEILRTVTEERGRNGRLWECAIRRTGAVQFCKAGLRNALGQRWDVNVIRHQHVQTK